MFAKNYYFKLNMVILLFGVIGVGISLNDFSVTNYNITANDYSIILITIVIPIIISVISNTVLEVLFRDSENKNQYKFMYSMIFHIICSTPYIYMFTFRLALIPDGTQVLNYLLVLVPIVLAITAYVYTYVLMFKEYKEYSVK